MTSITIEKTDLDFLQSQFANIVDERIYEVPSEYIEKIRYIPKGLSPKPGFFEFNFTPYWREPFNLLANDSGIQEIVIMKAAQIGYTVAILENAIIYFIGSNPKYVQFITADNALVEEMVKDRIDPMIDHAGLRDLIFAQSKRKGSRNTGDTTNHKQYPGGSINFVGSNNPDAFRGRTKQVSLGDEVDTFKDDKKEGSKIGIIRNRLNAFAETRKMVWGSTPLITQSSVIYKMYKNGDQRNYFIPCPICGEMQILKWHGVNDNGHRYGIDFQIEKGLPIYETVEYLCYYCRRGFKDYDKATFILDGDGEWRPTAESKMRHYASFWLNALYSPPGVYSWEKIVEDWVRAWDLDKDKMRDKEAYREFRNTKQGLPFEEKGESISYDKAIIHRRLYAKGTIDNVQIKNDTDGIALIVGASVDCQKNNLFVDIKAYTYGGRTYTIDFFSLDGPTEDTKSESWEKLDDFICNKVYIDSEGRQYKIQYTFVDSGKYAKYVYEFCSRFTFGVFPCKGERFLMGGITFKLFSKEVLDKSGCAAGYRVNTTRLKDHISNSLTRLEWKTDEFQPDWYPNFPQDLRDDYFKQFEAESKVDEYDRLTNVYKGSFWRQTPGADNHAFDSYVYHLAGLEMYADLFCREELALKALDWFSFWENAKKGIFYTS